MVGSTANDGGMRRIGRRMAAWVLFTALILLLPVVAMQFTEEVNWDLLDFAFMGTLLLGTGFTYEVVTRRAAPIVYRAAVGVALAAAFLRVWVNGAVGIIGDEAGPVNPMYLGVLAAGIVATVIVRFQPGGMARIMFVTAILQVLVPVIALITWPPGIASWGAAGVVGVFALNGFFVMLFVVSALLFCRAARSRREPGAA